LHSEYTVLLALTLAPYAITSTQGATVDYNQGSYYDRIELVDLRCTVAGIYGATATLRVGSTSGLNQAAIQKNSSTGGATQLLSGK
jgi:hypothetical protein